LQKVKEAVKALDDYSKNLKEQKGLWHDDIKKELPDLIEKSHVLFSSGQPCPRCNGSGRV
jgi:hypothetical protein